MGWDVPDLTAEERRVADEKYEAAQAEARRIYASTSGGSVSRHEPAGDL
jgi:hypothetical protein